jgi:urease alpha subunit
MSHCDILCDWTFVWDGASVGRMIGVPKTTKRPVAPQGISSEINRISGLKLAELRVLWQSRFGKPTPKALSRNLLVRQLAWDTQVKAFGGHDAATRKLLAAYGRQEADKVVLFRRLKPGTTVIREYQGVRHIVTIADEGFVWEGRAYASLSAIARSITGAR